MIVLLNKLKPKKVNYDIPHIVVNHSSKPTASNPVMMMKSGKNTHVKMHGGFVRKMVRLSKILKKIYKD